MWRVVLAASLLLTLALGAVADAKCATCVTSVVIDSDGASSVLRFAVRSMDGQPLPETGTAVVMQFDGNRGKCLTVSLVRTGVDGNDATYAGQFGWIYRGSVLSGRADIGGAIWDFSAPVDGTPGTFSLSSYQGSVNGANAPAIFTPQPVQQPVTITPDPATIDPRTAAATAAAETAARASQQGAPAPATPTLIDGLSSNTIGLMGFIVVVVAIVSAYVDRKRSLARAAATG